MGASRNVSLMLVTAGATLVAASRCRLTMLPGVNWHTKSSFIFPANRWLEFLRTLTAALQ